MRVIPWHISGRAKKKPGAKNLGPSPARPGHRAYKIRLEPEKARHGLVGLGPTTAKNVFCADPSPARPARQAQFPGPSPARWHTRAQLSPGFSARAVQVGLPMVRSIGHIGDIA